MLKIHLEESRGWDDDAERFVTLPALDVSLEHSLFTIAAWEAEFERPFLHTDDKTPEEWLRYIQLMSRDTLDPTSLLRVMSDSRFEIERYISSKQTATRISDYSQSSKDQIITAELIYGWMVAYRIPFDPCQHWHIQRLITLVRVCGIQQDPKPKKRPMADAIAERNALNAQRQAEMKRRKESNGH